MKFAVRKDSRAEIGEGEDLGNREGERTDEVASGRDGEEQVGAVVEDERDGGRVMKRVGQGNAVGFGLELVWGFGEGEDEVDGVVVTSGGNVFSILLGSEPFKERFDGS